MPTAHVRGVDLYYEAYGSPSDPHLIMAHGLMGSVALMKQFSERPEAIAARGLHVIAYDARGHGRSSYSNRKSDYHWSSLAADMRGLMQVLDIDRASVYGGSMGAGTALTLALAHPESVDKLLLMSPPPFGAQLRTARRYFGAIAYLYQLFGSSLTARIIMATPQAKAAQRQSPATNLRAFFASQRRAAVVPAIRGLVFDSPALPTERFAEIAQPTLILTHPDDPIHPLVSGELLHERMPHARLAVAPTAGYWQEQPDALTHIIASFVKDETIAQGLPEKTLHAH